MLMAPVAGWLFDRFGLKLPAVLGMGCVTVGFFLEALTFPLREFVWVAPSLLLVGGGLGLACPKPIRMACRVWRRPDGVRLLGCSTRFGRSSAMGMAIIGTVVAAQQLPKLAPLAEHYATTPAEKEMLEETLLQAVRGQAGSGHKLAERWPGALADLKESGAHSIADGYYLGSFVTFVGFLLAIALVAKKRPGADSAAGLPATIADSEGIGP